MSGSRTVAQVIDSSGLTPAYWRFASVVAIGTLLEFFDFYLVGFVLSLIAPAWHLTFGQVATVLVAGGVGAIAGSFVWGWAGDRFGRRRSLIVGMLLYSICTGLMALSPDGAWVFLAVLRFFVGAGVAGVLSVAIPLVVEMTPTLRRTSVSGLVTTAFVPFGSLLAALIAATFSVSLGWRGLLLIGSAPILLVPFVVKYVPESPYWLVEARRMDEAKAVLERFTGQTNVSLRRGSETFEHGTFAGLYKHKAEFWFTVLAWFGGTTVTYGVLLWGPTLLRLLLGISASEAAGLFIVVSLGGLAGRFSFSWLAQKIGRRPTGMLMGFGSAALLVAAAVANQTMLGPVSVFFVVLILINFTSDGGFANLAPMPPELYPANLRSHAMGLAEGVNGIGKIVGPLSLGLIAGTTNLITPQATVDALPPAFMYLAGCSLLVGVAFAIFPVETRGKVLDPEPADKPHEQSGTRA